MNIPEVPAGADWTSLLDGEARARLERDALLPFVVRQRWFAGKSRRLAAAVVADWGVVPDRETPAFLCLVDVACLDGGRERYFVPLVASDGQRADRILREHPSNVVARLSGPRPGLLHDVLEEGAAGPLLDAIAERRAIPMRRGGVQALRTTAFGRARGPAPKADLPARRLSGEQSNTSLLYADRLILKVLRRVEPGVNPDYEIGRHLTERTSFAGAPRLAGALEYCAGAEVTTVAVMHELVPHDTTAWDHALDHARHVLDRVQAGAASRTPPAPWPAATFRDELPALARETMAGYLEHAALLGRRTAELHLALATAAGDPAFEAEPLTAVDSRTLAATMRDRALAAMASVGTTLDRLPAPVAAPARRLVAASAALLAPFDRLAALDPAVSRIRLHGDYHLGQVLCAQGDVVIVDFEGEPLRAIEERRRKQPAMKDLAGMLRSFDYAAHVALADRAGRRPDEFARLEPWAAAWRGWASTAFLRAYLETAGGAGFVPRDPAALDVLLRAFVLDKALYELVYELEARPNWLHIPVLGILSLVELQDDTGGGDPGPEGPGRPGA